MKAHIRFADPEEATWCAEQDGEIAREILQRKLAAGELIVAEVAQRPIGYLRLEFFWPKLPYIGLVRVKESFLRQGIGREMVRFLEEFLRAKGHNKLLSSSQVDEPGSQAWHRAIGFRECGVLAGINDGAVDELFFLKRL